MPPRIPVILPLLQKLHLPRSNCEKTHSNSFLGLLDNTRGIMLEKLDKYPKKDSHPSPEKFLQFLTFTGAEIQEID